MAIADRESLLRPLRLTCALAALTLLPFAAGCSPQATATPLPTYTPRPTSTPRPTATPSPTPVPTPRPLDLAVLHTNDAVGYTEPCG